MNNRLLAIYLNDHLAGATAGRELARRARGATDGELSEFLTSLHAEIEEDREVLLAVMRAVGAGRDRVKVTAGVVAERFGRLKLNGSFFSRSPLSTLTELEGLALGVEGKRSLWLSLEQLDEPRLKAFAFDALAARAEAQRSALEGHRRTVARAVLS